MFATRFLPEASKAWTSRHKAANSSVLQSLQLQQSRPNPSSPLCSITPVRTPGKRTVAALMPRGAHHLGSSYRSGWRGRSRARPEPDTAAPSAKAPFPRQLPAGRCAGALQPYPGFQTSPWRSGRRHLGRAGRRERTAPASPSWEKRGERALSAAGEGPGRVPQPLRSAYSPRKLLMCCWQCPR